MNATYNATIGVLANIMWSTICDETLDIIRAETWDTRWDATMEAISTSNIIYISRYYGTLI